MRKLIFQFLIIAITSLLASCQSPRQSGVDSNSTTPIASTPLTTPATPPTVAEVSNKPSQTVCKSPRAEMCTKEYRPVCATKDTGVRCVTTPCPSTEQVTKSNACTACSDEDVFSYVEGACS